MIRSPNLCLLVALVASAVPISAGEEDAQQEAIPLELGADPRDLPAPVAEFLTTEQSLYRIGHQDLLEIQVFGIDDLDQTVRVAGDGSITMPLLGRIDVGGLTRVELESLLARLLGERYIHDPQVTVFVREYESRRVAVTGAVKLPGAYEMLGRRTLLEMISMAGGLDSDLGNEIFIFRRGKAGNTERIAVDLDRLVYQADPSLNHTIQPGDIVYVPTVEKVSIFVSGAVNNPDRYEIPHDEPVTVLKAITIAGGTTDRAALKKVQIMRTDRDGNRITLLVDLKKIRSGKAEDPILQRDDIVLVPESFF